MFLSRPLLLWLNRRIARSIRRPISAHDQWPSLVLGTCQKRKLRPSVTRWQAAGQSRVPWPSLPLAPGSFSSSRWGWPPTVAQTALSSPRHSPSWLPRPEATGTRPGNPWSPLKKRGEGGGGPRPTGLPRSSATRNSPRYRATSSVRDAPDAFAEHAGSCSTWAERSQKCSYCSSARLRQHICAHLCG